MDSNLYEILVTLCEKRQISPYRMCKDIGIQPSVMSDLKAGRRKGVNAATASKIASYFSVSLNHLMGEEEENEDENLAVYLEELKNRKEMRMLFSLAHKASKEDVEKAVKIIEALKDN